MIIAYDPTQGGIESPPEDERYMDNNNDESNNDESSNADLDDYEVQKTLSKINRKIL